MFFDFSSICSLLSFCNLRMSANQSEVLFDFTQPAAVDESQWESITDQVRRPTAPEYSTASIQSVGPQDHLFFAKFSYDLKPLDTGACFAGVRYKGKPWDLSSYSGIQMRVRRTGTPDVRILKVKLQDKYSYEMRFEVCFFLFTITVLGPI